MVLFAVRPLNNLQVCSTVVKRVLAFVMDTHAFCESSITKSCIRDDAMNSDMEAFAIHTEVYVVPTFRMHDETPLYQFASSALYVEELASSEIDDTLPGANCVLDYVVHL